MKTIIRLLAPIMLLAHIYATPVYPCDWGTCDQEWVDNMNSLLGLTCDSELCFRSLREDTHDVYHLNCPPPTCYDRESDCGKRFRRDMTEFVRLLPGCRYTSKFVIRLICKQSGELPCCHPDYLKYTSRLIKLMASKPGKITLMGTFSAAKEGHELTKSNQLLHTLAQTNYYKFMTVRMALAAGQVETAAMKSATTLLMLASAMGDLEVAEDLLAKGEDVNAQNKAGRTALMFAACEGHPKVVETLLEAGADPDLKDKNGDTAATLASKNGHERVVKLLGQGAARQ